MTVFRGKWIALPDGSILDGGYVVCENGVIQQVTKIKPDGEVVNHDGLIAPGLVNAHTHLEFSDLVEPLGNPGTEFVEWVGLVMNYRRTRDESIRDQVVQSGLAESAREGVCAIGEISTFDWNDAELNVHVTDFRELIGFRLEQANDIQRLAESHLNRKPESTCHCFGLSPHAPYSINRESLQNSVQMSKDNKIPLAMHLAETRAELELLADHSGAFYELLNRLGLWTENNFSTGASPLDILEVLSQSSRGLVIHGNYLSAKELQFIAEHSAVLKLVYCPRTHDFFGHDPYPIQQAYDKGIELALGTDSRASNPDLSIWTEMEFVAQKHACIHPAEILKMGTINGAKALGIEYEMGSIEPGKKSKLYFGPSETDSDWVRALVGI